MSAEGAICAPPKTMAKTGMSRIRNTKMVRVELLQIPCRVPITPLIRPLSPAFRFWQVSSNLISTWKHVAAYFFCPTILSSSRWLRSSPVSGAAWLWREMIFYLSIGKLNSCDTFINNKMRFALLFDFHRVSIRTMELPSRVPTSLL